MSSDLLTATEFARICQVTPRTIRWYQKKGLLRPVKIDDSNRYAYFSPSQALLIFKIKLLQQHNLSLAKIYTIISEPKQKSLNLELKALERQIKEKQKLLKFLHYLDSILVVKLKFTKEIIGPFYLLSKTINNGNYYEIGNYLEELRSLADKNNLKQIGSEMTFYLDPELKFKPKNTRLEVAIRVENNNCTKQYHSTKVLSFTYTGPYEFLSLIYDKLDKYILKEKIRLTGPVFEMYLKSLNDTKKSYHYVTKICYPV